MSFSLRRSSTSTSPQPPFETQQLSYSLRSRRKETTPHQAPGTQFRNKQLDISTESHDSDSVDSDDEAAKHVVKGTGPDQNSNLNFKWWQKGYLRYYSFHEVPRYLQDNPDIHGHYRAFYSFKENWISLIHCHNETVNSWCHLLAGLFALTISLCATQGLTLRVLNLTDAMDKLMIALFGALATFTFWTSGLYHLHLSHSQESYILFGCWDYAGISATVAGSSITVLYYLWYCEPVIRGFWLTLVVAVNMVGVIGPNFNFWPTPEFRPIRSMLYILSATISGSPVFHYAYIHGYSALPLARDNIALPMMCLSNCMYLIGVAIYMTRFPESVWPGRFDIWGASHQVWHLCVVAAVVAHLYCVFGLIEWRHEFGSCVASF
ncbi:hypothetical protein HDU98_009694 [Podochytrium sp. JEL0797]|nr:hypothetical protein HDU98_009694 [Podochytrium sp. JEL0797]